MRKIDCFLAQAILTFTIGHRSCIQDFVLFVLANFNQVIAHFILALLSKRFVSLLASGKNAH